MTISFNKRYNEKYKFLIAWMFEKPDGQRPLNSQPFWKLKQSKEASVIDANHTYADHT